MNLKTYVGRIFLLKNFKRLACKSKARYIKSTKHRSEFNDVVFVFDENTQYVKVSLKDGGVAWIKKFYLLKEIKGQTDKTETPKLENILDSLTFLLEKCDTSLISEKDLLKVNSSIMNLREIIQGQQEPLNLAVI